MYISLSFGEAPSAVVIALVALIRITPIASQIVASLASISAAVPSLNQFELLFGYIFQKQKQKRLISFDGFSDKIQLNNVSYSHGTTKNSVIDINMTIKKNSYVSFIGPSGSGKTTSVDILIGLLKPSSGNVSIDQDLLEEVELDSFLAHVGYVQQTPFLFNGSIKDNLLWSNPSA
ncbi:MAG: ATP-binding cassette domain-containing protein, partial [Rhodobacterales bacterium]